MQNTTHLNANSTALMPRSHGRLLSGLVIAFHIPLIILIYFIYNYFFHKRPSASNSPPPVDPSPGIAPALQLHVVNSIPMTDFKTVGTEKEECVVCLVEFKEGDKLRILPQCRHRFHVDCVDMWFRSHANCPLCRTAVVEKVVAGSESMV